VIRVHLCFIHQVKPSYNVPILAHLAAMHLSEVNYITSLQNQKAHEEEHKKPSSYHSFSQSPPYDCQYEERRNGKQSAFLSRKPGSDRGHEGKISGYSYSSHSLRERMSQGVFTSERCGSRTSNCSGSSTGDTVKSAPQSPIFPDSVCFSPPVLQDQSNVQSTCGLTSSQVGRNIFFFKTINSHFYRIK